MSTLTSPLIAQDTCLSEDAVLAFHRGETSESERQRIHGHMDACDDCRKLLMMTARMEQSRSALGVELDSMERFAAVLGSSLHMTTFAKGKQLAHRFDVIRFVDRGGMGEVYEAFDAVVGARVALKALLCTAAADDPGTSRLGEEVKLARRIAHANVCHIYDLHEHREAEHAPLRFLAMEFVDGVTLKERLRGGGLPIEEACAIGRQLLLGLDAVHAAGVLHLDFKSQNVMLRHGKAPAQAVVMDFSLSRAFENELRLRTSERHAAGSIGYMSPEQLECQSTIGPAADVYAFGVVFYEMLTGHMPFQGDSPAAIILKQLKSRAAPPSQLRPALSPALDEFVLTCLSRHARSRFQSAASAIEALDRCLPTVSSQRRWNGWPWLRTVAVALLAAAAAGTLVYRATRGSGAEASIARAAQPLHPAPPMAPAPAGAATPGPGREDAPHEPKSSAPAGGLLEGDAKPAAVVVPTRPRAAVTQRKRSAETGSASTGLVRSPALPTAETGRAPASPPAAGAPSEMPQPVDPNIVRPEGTQPAQGTDAKTPQEDWVPKTAPDFLL